ncbi:MAG TPA: glycosyltransferase family 4 protein, partial [Ramlibacter sp.]|nr:glycosyltransferase family 4 protein [Ramlibacter sp.]
MKIAQVAPLAESVPPRAYGGTERVVSYLTESLVEMGHEVTLFASADSVTCAELVPVVPRSLRLETSQPDSLVWYTIMLDQVMRAAHTFDVIHFHTAVLQLALMRGCTTPCVTTAHGRLDLPDLKALFRRFPEHPMVSISNSQRTPLPWLNWRATVYHGLPLDLYAPHPEPQDYFAFLGRISPEKRADRAIEIAKACGTPLRIAAKVDAVDQAYFESTIQPLLSDPLVSFIGEIDDQAKNDFLGNARALLMPVDWPEPFGLVMIEAMACGTPTIAYGRGSVPEVIENGVTGFIVETLDAAVRALVRAPVLCRRRCRQVFEERFTAARMARDYLDLYERLAAGPATPL